MAQLVLASSSLTAATTATLVEALALVEARLDGWASNSAAYNSLLEEVFAAAGTDLALWQQATAELQSTLQSSGLAIGLELLANAELPGLKGAYTAQAPGGGERIFLNAAWLQTASTEQIETVLLEEIGHAIDTRLNGSADSPGDEGERFSALLRGLSPSPAAASENDQRQITLQGQLLLVEAAADTTAPRVDLSGFRNPAFAGTASAFGIGNVSSGGVDSPARSAFVDIDGDGDLDAFIGEFFGNTLFFRNTGNATAPAFASASVSAFGLSKVGYSASPAFVDIDGDGDFDAFIGNNAGNTLFFRNTGNATAPAFAGFSIAFGLTTNVGYNASPAFADIDGDGDLDAFIGESFGNTFFFRNTAAPGATAPAFAGSASAFGLPDVGSTPRPAFADIDGDGDLDAFIGSGLGNTFFFRNTAAAGATAPAFAAASTNPFGIPVVGDVASPAFADIDGDGDLDAFIGNKDGNTTFFRNTGSGGLSSTNANGTFGFGSIITIEVPFSEVVFVTGIPTLQLETGSTDRFATFTGGSGSRVLTFTYTVQAGDTSVDLDVTSSSALLLNGGSIRDVAGNNAVLTLPAPGATGSLGANAGLVVNAVAKPDTTAPRVDLSGFRNPAFAAGASAFGLTDVGYRASPTFADIDGDGDLDAFVSNNLGETLFFRNTGSPAAPAFAGATSAFGLPDVGSFAASALVDIDGDGDLDAFIGNLLGNTLFLRNNGSATAPAFTGASLAFGLTTDVGGFARPAFADIDGDGDLDAFIGNGYGNTLFFRNTGNATAPGFADSASAFGLPNADGAARPAFADIDGDGDLDAFLGGGSGTPLFLRNTGSATAPAFAGAASGFGLSGFPQDASPAFADIDGDGDLDGFIGNIFGNTLFFRNTGSGGLSSTNANGTYGPGSVITFELPFSEVVFVTGSPTLRLETGSTDRFATFAGGSGSRVLTFTYTVQPDDSSADLDVLGSNALLLNGATIRDAAGNDAVLTLPAPGAPGSLGANAALVIDGIAPRGALRFEPAFAAASTNPFGLSDVGDQATPSFADSDGDGDLDLFIGNKLGSTLFFRNTAAAGATAPAFAAPSTNPFGITTAGFSAAPTLIDADADGDLDLFIGDKSGNTLFFRNTAAAGATDPAFAAPSTNPFGLTDAGSFISSPIFVDIDGDGDLDAFISNYDGNTLFFRNTAAAGATAPAFAAASTNPFGIADVGIRAKLAFGDSDGDGDLDLLIGNVAGNTLFFRNTAVAGATAPAFAAPSLNPFGLTTVGTLAAPVFTDSDADGDLDLFIGNNEGNLLFFRNTASTPVAPVAATTPDGTYAIGALITLTIRFSEAVIVNTTGGTPTLALETGTVDRFATFSGGSGTDILSFSYTVQPGDSSADLDLLSADALVLNGATIRDAAGNDAILTLAAPGATGSLAANADLLIDGVAPTLTDGPTPSGPDGFSLTAAETATAALLTAGDVELFSTALTANLSTLFTVAAQDSLTTTSLRLTDLAGNRTTAAAVLLGTTTDDSLVAPTGEALLYGFGGNDTYRFDTDLGLANSVLIDTDISDTGTSGVGLSDIDTLDFSATSTRTIAIDLRRTTAQAINNALTLTLAPGSRFENIIGGSRSDSLLGNLFSNTLAGLSGNDILAGFNGADSLSGGDGDDRLDGGAGRDTIDGGAGSDTYRFDTDDRLGFDTIIDTAVSGSDTFDFSATTTRSITIDLRGSSPRTQSVNDHLTLTLTPTTKIENVIGSAASDTITGNLLVNNLQGGGGDDSLSGFSGNDSLSGGAGNDTLTGGLGADTFRFAAPLDPLTNRDSITDFSSADADTIALDNSIFSALSFTGTLAPDAFLFGAAATTADHRILYNSTTGDLLYDQDGNGAISAIAFATLTPGLSLSNASFIVT